MPIDYKKYHKDWKKISKCTIARAGGKCELCGAPNRITIFRGGGLTHMWDHYGLDGSREVMIVLTVHHIDGDVNNNTKYNLIALCQRCRLRLDMGKHLRNRGQNATSI